MNLFEGQEYRCRCRERTCGHRMGKERMGQIDRIALTYTLWCIKQIASEKVLYNIGSSAESSVMI